MESTTRKGNEMRTQTYKIRDTRPNTPDQIGKALRLDKDTERRYAEGKVHAILNQRHGSLYASIEQEKAIHALFDAAEAVPGFIVADPAIPNLTVQLDEGCDD